jgi:hypothetical protein
MREKMFWLTCTASKGQFSEEYAVSGTDFRGEEFSFFVGKSFVETERDVELGETNARLQVVAVEKKDGLVLIQLPGQTFGNGNMITVREDDLRQAECPATSS